MYCLLYHPALKVEFIKPRLSLDRFIAELNQFATKPRHNSYQSKLLAKAVRANWIVQDLKNNSVQKPLLINEKWQIIIGDTRLMAVQYHPGITEVSVLCTVPEHRANRFADFSIIHSIDHLAEKLSIEPNRILLKEDWMHNELSEIDFDYPGIIHHLHNESQRYRMIVNYLQKQSHNFEFNRDWFSRSIDWYQLL